MGLLLYSLLDVSVFAKEKASNCRVVPDEGYTDGAQLGRNRHNNFRKIEDGNVRQGQAGKIERHEACGRIGSINALLKVVHARA